MTRRIAITPGEPAGIGPDLVITIAQQAWSTELVVVASKALLIERAEQLKLPLTLIDYDEKNTITAQKAGTLTILNVDLNEPCSAGTINNNNGGYVVEALRIACEKNMTGEFDAVVTGPVHKGLVNKSGIAVSGHTE